MESRIDVEYDVNRIEEKIRREYELEGNWYGDVYGVLVEDKYGNNLMTAMEFAKTEEEYNSSLDEIKANFNLAAKNYN